MRALKVHMSPELAAAFSARDVQGNRLFMELGDPDAEGFYVPTISVDYTDNLISVIEAENADLRAKLEKMGQEAKANEYALSQEANGTLCRCRYGTDMMGQVPEGSFCPFCGYRRYESIITGKWQAAAQQEKE